MIPGPDPPAAAALLRGSYTDHYPGDQEDVFKNIDEALGTRGQSLAAGVQGPVLRFWGLGPLTCHGQRIVLGGLYGPSFVLWRAVGRTMDKEAQGRPSASADRATAR